jgi:GntR family transcriptional regulator
VYVGPAAAPAEVSEAFGLDAGARLLVRRHVVRTAEVPVEVGASWFRPGDVRGTSLERPDVVGRPLYQEVEDETGRRYATARDQLTARLPSREEAELLQIRPDTPVLVLLHVAYDTEHRPIEVAQATWPGPMTALIEEYAVPAPRPGLPVDEPELTLG